MWLMHSLDAFILMPTWIEFLEGGGEMLKSSTVRPSLEGGGHHGRRQVLRGDPVGVSSDRSGRGLG